jgi:hypothetical protein
LSLPERIEAMMATPAKTTSSEEFVARHESPTREFDLEQVRNAVRGIRFGEVRLIIQDGVVVQIERVEKQRLR